MKTPRDILFARNQAAVPKLDAVRRSVVDKLNNQETKEQSWPAFLVDSLLGCPNKLWRELVWPSRRIWAGLAAVWVLLIAINLTQDNSLPKVQASSGPAVMSFREQQRMLNELLANRTPSMDTNRPRQFISKPRTEISEFYTV